MKILALDIGTNMGWAFSCGEGTEYSGSWELASAKEITAQGKKGDDRKQDCRPCRLIKHLLDLEAQYGTPDVIIFEDVQFMSFQLQTQLWASLRTAIWMLNCCHGKSIRFETLNVKTLKKEASGTGNATKAQMSKALSLQEPDKFKWAPSSKRCFLRTVDGRPVTDDEVDAIHLLKHAKKLYGRPT